MNKCSANVSALYLSMQFCQHDKFHYIAFNISPYA